MAKKDFSNINTGRLYDTIAQATATEPKQEQIRKTDGEPRKTYTDAEAMQFMEEMKTSGRKGIKAPRINLAFTPSNYQYVKTMAQVRGESLTSFINHIIELSMQENADIYERALDFKNSF